MAKFCPACGNNLEDDAAFCTRCGTAQQMMQSQANMSQYMNRMDQMSDFSQNNMYQYTYSNPLGGYSIGTIILCLLFPIIGIIVGLSKLSEGTGKVYLLISGGMMLFCLICAVLLI